MELVLVGVGAIFSIIALVCNIIILIHAFKSSVGEGFMCLCIPCYILYYMFSKFEHEHKTLIIVGSLGGNLIGQIFVRMPSLMHPHSGYGGGYP